MGSLQGEMWLINSIEISLFFSVMPELIDAVVAAWHKVNRFIVELVSCIKTIYEWLFLRLHYYGIGDFPSVATA